MGYACPVCGDPQQDERHLANHLAFTALLGREDHEAWLEENAPGWAEDGERELADRVAEHAEETEFPQVFEDTTGSATEHDDPGSERSGALFEEADDRAHGHGHGRGSDDYPDRPHDAPPGVDARAYDPADPADPETREILAEAREMTREMLAESEARSENESEARSENESEAENGDADPGSGQADGESE